MQSLSTKILALVMFITIACAAKPATAAQPVRVACVGDSITFGAGVPNNWVNAWPGQLQKMLGKHYKVANFGHSGATLLKDGDLPYWKTPEYKHSTAFKGKIVIIMLGTNDTKAWNWKHHARVCQFFWRDAIFHRHNPCFCSANAVWYDSAWPDARFIGRPSRPLCA